MKFSFDGPTKENVGIYFDNSLLNMMSDDPSNYNSAQLNITIGSEFANLMNKHQSNAYADSGVTISIPDFVECVSVAGSYYFNGNISISDNSNLSNCYYMFSDCFYYNKPVTIQKPITNCYRMFSDCRIFNQPVSITVQNANCSYMFYNCRTFNQPVNFIVNSTDCSYAFYNCYGFNQHIDIGDYTTNCSNMFYLCNSFNQNVYISDSVTNCSSMFLGCTEMNGIVTIGSSVVNCANMFFDAVNFNVPVIIPTSVNNCANMFRNCYLFNRDVNIGNGVKNCSLMFGNCYNFGKSITIPDSVNYIYGIFSNCSEIQGNFIFGNNCRSFDYTFDNSILNHDVNIFINSKNVSYTQNMIQGKNDYVSCNIYCNNLGPFIANTSATYSILKKQVTWEPIVNGYCNTLYNVYLYNNYSAENGLM